MKKLIALAWAILLVPLNANAAAWPTDAQQTCVENNLAQWFKSGQVTANGQVQPADSLTFNDATDCNFYKWSMQMFLWLTSQLPDGRLVLDGPDFLDVSASDNGVRHFIYNGYNLDGMSVRSAKPPLPIPETGQAGGDGVLMSREGSLVYYGIHVNDVYSVFLSAQKANGQSRIKTNGKFTFPTTKADLPYIELSERIKVTLPFPDEIALTMELKTSWVDLSTIPAADQSKYITIQASVPAYKPSTANPTTLWKLQSSPVTKTLALTGMHVVGSAKGHPEMIWASFEHQLNAPDASYYYLKQGSNTPQQVAFSNPGHYRFMAAGGTETGANVEYMAIDSNGDIKATTGNSITHSNTYRINPWGSPGTSASASNNTEIISINQSVIGTGLTAGDIRANYFLLGAVWTHGIVPARLCPKGDPNCNNPTPNFTTVGSPILANATMETYQQTDATGCFACHYGSGNPDTWSFGPFSLSHIYSELKSLFPQN